MVRPAAATDHGPLTTDPRLRLHLALLLSAAVALIGSGVGPADRVTWVAETLPVVIGGAVLVGTYRRFRFTTLTYALVWGFALILVVGGHYTYADEPVGNWARDALGLSRNHFDRFGHFFQGVIPAMVAREVYLRRTGLRERGWLFACCASVALAVSAGYELFEWGYAVTFGGKQADDFLGSQGDVWDAQKDMLMALLGAVSSLALLGRWQDRQMLADPRIGTSPAPPTDYAPA